MNTQNLLGRPLVRYRLRLAYLTLAVWLAEHLTCASAGTSRTGSSKTPCSTRCSPSSQTRRSSSPGGFAFDKPPEAASDYLEARDELREVVVGVLTFRATGPLGSLDRLCSAWRTRLS